MEPKWLVNGRDSGVAASDRGLAYGDGLFETMAVRHGEIRWLDLHLERLAAGCAQLSIPFPATELILEDLRSLLRAAPERCVAKLIVTRGNSARGYRPPKDPVPTRISGVSTWPAYPAQHYSEGIRVAICRTPVSENPSLAGLKHLGRLEQVLGQAELETDGVAEGLMLTTSGIVVGGTMSNVFCVESGELRTPRLDRAGVRGVMRRIVMSKASDMGLRVLEEDLTLARVERADEVFVTNAVFGLWPVREIGAMKVPSSELAKRLLREIGIDEE